MKLSSSETAEFYKKYHKTVRRYVNNCPHYDKDEVWSDVWRRIMEHHNYDPSKGTVKTWLHHLVRSVCGNLKKKRSLEKDILGSALPLDEAINVMGYQDAGHDRDEIDRILSASTLSERDQRIMIQFHLDGYTGQDIAEREGMSLPAVRQVLQRAMRALQQQQANP